jgi:uncharacterized protein (TIGR03435 family)
MIGLSTDASIRRKGTKLAAVLVASSGILLQAQSFEVASLRPWEPGSPARPGIRGGPGTADPGRISYTRYPLRLLISVAFEMPLARIEGPVWMDSEAFNIEAKLPPGATREQVQTMLRNLLTERFQLKLHRDYGSNLFMR